MRLFEKPDSTSVTAEGLMAILLAGPRRKMSTTNEKNRLS
jgi:hypothetical protein